MPARPRLTKASKALKENECVTKTGKQNHRATVVKPSRKVLADKTNSASDDNTSILTDQNSQKKLISKKSTQDKIEQNDFRPRRTRKLPSRYKENVTLTNLSNSKEETSTTKQPSKQAAKTVSVKRKVSTVKAKISSDKINKSLINKTTVIPPFKTLNKKSDDSLVQNRPKRICRLPSKFDDHCISPNKLLPVQPINTSTPLANKTKNVTKKLIVSVSKIDSKQNTIKNYFNNSSKTTADSNNNAKNSKSNKLSPKKSPLNIPITEPSTFKIINTSSGSKNSLKRDSNKLDIYEFTFDPKEEPPAKKKKKRTVTKKPSKPKTVTFKSNYDKNLAKALADLKNAMLEKSKSVNIKDNTNAMLEKSKSVNIKDNTNAMLEKSKSVIIKDNINAIVLPSEKNNYDQGNEVSVKTNLDFSEDCLNNKNYNSVRVEDIAMDIQEDDINYSPVNSPSHPIALAHDTSKPKDINRELSFFDDHPVASSSMNVSNPSASPWRVEFQNLPIKWPVNTYVKPNMTPAFESSYINFNEKKKHVYTNMLAESHEPLPEIVDSPTLKQTSIMSFIKEVVDKHASRKKSKLTPVKANSLFEEADISVAETPKKRSEVNENVTPVKHDSLLQETAPNDSDIQNEKSDDKYFGFDQSEDQENISPKKKNKGRQLKTRSRGVLQELNVQKGPMRVNIPISKLKPVQNVVSKDLPEVPDNTDVTEPSLPQVLENADTNSVHLFEDIEIVHHLKPTRKSYGKPKKVAFAKNTTNSDSPLSDLDHASDEDLDDSSFRLPSIKPIKATKKKKTNKQKLSKKEEKEIETWAAGFNSMCEDVDQFDLLVE